MISVAWFEYPCPKTSVTQQMQWKHVSQCTTDF